MLVSSGGVEPPVLDDVDGLRFVSSVGGVALFRGRWLAEGDRSVAVRVLAGDGTDPGDVAPLWRQAVEALPRHPNLVDVLLMGVMPATRDRYLITEWTRGSTLQAAFEERGVLSVAEVLAVGVQLAGGLGTLHRFGLVHGDVSCATVIVTSWGGSPQVKLDLVGAVLVDGAERGRDAAGLGALLFLLFTGVEVSSLLDRAELQRRGAPEAFVSVLADLVENDPGSKDGTLIQRCGRALQQIELAERRIPTELTLLGEQSSTTTLAASLRVHPMAPHAEPPGSRSSPDVDGASQADMAGSPRTAVSGSTVGMVTTAGIKAGWGAAPQAERLSAAQSAVGQLREKTDYPLRFMQAFHYPISLIR